MKGKEIIYRVQNMSTTHDPAHDLVYAYVENSCCVMEKGQYKVVTKHKKLRIQGLCVSWYLKSDIELHKNVSL